MTPVPKKRIYPPASLFFARIMKLENGCWQWTGATTGPRNNTRPALQLNRQKYTPRQWGWVIAHGEPSSVALTALCLNLMCVNPSHMAERRARICSRGHQVSGDNCYTEPNGRRACRACRRLRQSSPRQVAMQRQRVQNLPDEERRRRLQKDGVRKRAESHLKRSVRLAGDIALWVPEARRWLTWDEYRWIRVEDQVAQWVIGKHLDSIGRTPKGDNRNPYVRKVMDEMKRLRKPLEDAA